MAGNMQDNFDENGNPIRCSFCGKEQGQVRRLVKGPTNIFICDECVAACSEILEESLASDFMDAARNGKLPGFLNDHGQAASQPAADPETEGFELEDDRQVITHVRRRTRSMTSFRPMLWVRRTPSAPCRWPCTTTIAA
mgnify:CR=1 FL=1